ncbi:hypothetical protein K402DRAFT_450258 [Aulographum hederae CBS 113979]|uniref:Uncharacterized protein n=1 Tax=Aulographum hederae CBS 113979 TaxID=1176131 RepID=A0A6G1HG35_9PEZI|nr:hypothetical protein K402DRAFT_450258 [Aulographum hederae CBS 113979]
MEHAVNFLSLRAVPFSLHLASRVPTSRRFLQFVLFFVPLVLVVLLARGLARISARRSNLAISSASQRLHADSGRQSPMLSHCRWRVHGVMRKGVVVDQLHRDQTSIWTYHRPYVQLHHVPTPCSGLRASTSFACPRAQPDQRLGLFREAIPNAPHGGYIQLAAPPTMAFRVLSSFLPSLIMASDTAAAPRHNLLAPESPQARRMTLNTIIEDEPQITQTYLTAWPRRTNSASSEDDFPTPRAVDGGGTRATEIEHRPDFDDLYDVTDDEGVEVPLACSKSVRDSGGTSRASSKKSNRYPSLIIPSPTAWPTIQKYQASLEPQMTLTSPILSPNPRMMALLNSRKLADSSGSAAPSLDGSLTSEELSNISCPSTPDIIQNANDTGSESGDSEGGWGAPALLHPQALQTLHHLTPLEEDPSNLFDTSEMQEVVEGFNSGNSGGVFLSPVDAEGFEPLSALSVPSPGGFFASLNATSRHTWAASPVDRAPSTSVALEFYGIPWRKPPEQSTPRGSIRAALSNRSRSRSPDTKTPDPSPLSYEGHMAQHDSPSYPSVSSDSGYSSMHQTASGHYTWSKGNGTIYEESDSSPVVQGSVQRPISSQSNGFYRRNLPDKEARSQGPEASGWIPDTRTATGFSQEHIFTPDRNRPPDILIKSLSYDGQSDGPLTARRMSPEGHEFPGLQSPQVLELSYEYNENYEKELESTAVVNIDNTCLWLDAQESYLASLRSPDFGESSEKSSSSSPPPSIIKSSRGHHSRESSLESNNNKQLSRSKSVRFADEPSAGSEKHQKPHTPKDRTFVQGFAHIRNSTFASDVFVHRRERIESLTLDRKCLTTAHRNALLGRYELTDPSRPVPARPVSEFYTDEESNAQKELLGRVQRERQALLQIKPVSWNIEATKMLNGGTLLTSPAGRTVFRETEARILDLGGQASCDWAWEVALQHPSATVYTVLTADQQQSQSSQPPPAKGAAGAGAAEDGTAKPTPKIQGPSNHRTTTVPNLWTLPFPSNHFTIISARSLYMHLKTDKPTSTPKHEQVDEYDLCLRECLRCLKPGGYLEFSLLDADILKADQLALAMSVEFGFMLKTRGYDPAPTKAFLPRLRRAGFGRVRRAWLVLPMVRVGGGNVNGGGREEEGSTTADASCITGLIGAWAWEKWMLKMQMEMGREEERLLEGVSQALDEGARSGAAWRYLSGWAMKPI